MSQAIRLLIADDHPVVRDGLRGIFEASGEFEVAGEAANGREAVDRAAALRPDVVLMDLRMPGMDGVEATRAVCSSRPGTAVVVLTTYTDDESILAVLQAGAAGYLTKNASTDDIRRALEAAAAGQSVLDPVATARLVEAAARLPAAGVGGASGVGGTGGPGPGLPDGLTEREGEVLALIAQGLSNAEIAAQLFVSRSTVKTHINQIFAKTGSRDRAQAIIYAQRNEVTLPPAGAG